MGAGSEAGGEDNRPWCEIFHRRSSAPGQSHRGPPCYGGPVVAGARFGIVLLPESLRDFGPLCREAEATGFEWLGVADSQSVFHELYVALTLAALETSRIRLGPLVTNPQTRHLVVTASAMASLDELSGGRVALGLGSGDSAIYTLGAPPATVAGSRGGDRHAATAHERRGGATRADGMWQVHRARAARARSIWPPRARARWSWPGALPTA